MGDEDVRAKLIAAAGPVFAQKGYTRATIREICRRAKVNVAAVNYHFGGKARLYRETVAAIHPTRFSQETGVQWADDTPPEKKLRDFIALMLRRMLEHQLTGWQERLLVREFLEPTPFCRNMIREHLGSGLRVLQGIVRELLPADLPEEVVLRYALSIIGQCVYYRTARNILPIILSPEQAKRITQIDALVEHITAVSLAAMRAARDRGDDGRVGNSLIPERATPSAEESFEVLSQDISPEPKRGVEEPAEAAGIETRI